MAGTGTKVFTTDVNNPYTVGVRVMGTGIQTSGYGQTTFGAAVTTSTIISATDFNNIRYDLLNASAHQNGTAAALNIVATSGANIVSTDATAFSAYANTIDTNRFSAHSSRLSTMAYGGGSRTASWASLVQASYTINFINADYRRWFWNGGGKVRITSSRTGGAASAQNTDWSNLLAAAGTREFGGPNYLTWSGTQYTTSSSAPYAANQYSISVSKTTSSDSFFLFWLDNYTDPMPGAPPLPEDIVDGTLSYSVDIVYPSGGHALTPSGTWTSYQPSSYTASNITGG